MRRLTQRRWVSLWGMGGFPAVMLIASAPFSGCRGSVAVAPDAGQRALGPDAGDFDAGLGDAGTPDSGAPEGCFPEPALTIPVVQVGDFGAVGDGVTDDTIAIQAALDSMTDGGTLVFRPLVYAYSAVLHVRQANVHLWGYDAQGDAGATLFATDFANQEVGLESNGTALDGFVLTANTDGTRRSALPNHRIVLQGAGLAVIDNRVMAGTAAGIFAYGASDYVIARNYVGNTYADHIHNTGPSSNGRILFNTIDGSIRGDDAIALVAYTASPNTDFLIHGNVVLGSAWGNGIDISGGQNVTVTNNSIANICVNGGIVVKNEPTFNPSAINENVLVANNDISYVEQPGCVGLGPQTGQLGMLAFHATPGYGRNILFAHNTVDHAWPGAEGVARGSGYQSQCEVGFLDNAITNTPSPFVFGQSSTAQCSLVCSGDTVDGGMQEPTACNAGTLPAVTGSTFQCP